jgi:3'-phosphoadenosine 5'-phosphosulfate sulfotransferase (PAPS reductase)/FAD synthetase
VSGLDAYHRDNKIEPMQRALRELHAGTWFAGLRRDQARTRRDVPLVQRSGDFWKVHPIADWSDRDVYDYLKAHDAALSPALAPGLCLDRRPAHHPAAGCGRRCGGDALPRTQAGMRAARSRR